VPQGLGLFLPPSCSCLHSIHNIMVWIALLICSIYPPEEVKSSFLEYWPQYFELTLLLGKMLNVARYGPHGGTLHLLCQGWYDWSTWTQENLCFDRLYIGNSHANHTTWLEI
jgi:hypothetical protein